MKRKICLFVCLVLSVNLQANAASGQSQENQEVSMVTQDGRIVGSIFYKDGEMVINYSDLPAIADEEGMSQNAIAESVAIC